jgi:hypothetical protein
MWNSAAHNLIFDEIIADDTPEFSHFYQIYAQAFPLKDERESPEALGQILGFNNNTELQLLYGPYKEIIASIRLGNGTFVGGINFGITTSPTHRSVGIPASVQVIYAFILDKYRGIFPMRVLTEYCRKKALEIFRDIHRECMYAPLIFFEVNNPLRMTREQVKEDTEKSGIDPFRRYPFWQRSLSSMPLDFAYVQPRLRKDAEPIHYLDLFCTRELPQGIPAKLLLNHLHSFVSISVLKGQNASKDSDFHAMEEWLGAQDTVLFKNKHCTEVHKIMEIGKLRQQGKP